MVASQNKRMHLRVLNADVVTSLETELTIWMSKTFTPHFKVPEAKQF